MSDIFDYMKWRGDLSIDSDPLNELDSLILARFSYAPFDCIGLLEDSSPITVGEAATALLELPYIEQHVLWKTDVELFAALRENPRYAKLKLTRFINLVDADTQMQFSAVAISLREDLHYIAFRGTDNTLVGWKEDFNMTFTCPVPAQEYAVNYLNRIAAALPGRLILGGHSKGGNLAVFAAAFCREDIQARIDSIYNFDGPGFDDRILETAQYHAIRERTRTFVPQSSVIGMLLGHEEQYTIVESTEKSGLMQHDIYSWQVERKSLAKLESVTTRSRFIDQTLKKRLAETPPAQREQFVDAMYAIFAQTNAKTVKELSDNWLDSAKAMLSVTRNLDEDTRKLIVHTLSILVRSAKESYKNFY